MYRPASGFAILSGRDRSLSEILACRCLGFLRHPLMAAVRVSVRAETRTELERVPACTRARATLLGVSRRDYCVTVKRLRCPNQLWAPLTAVCQFAYKGAGRSLHA